METLKHFFLTNNIRYISKLSFDQLEFRKQHSCYNLTPCLLTIIIKLQKGKFNKPKVKTFTSEKGSFMRIRLQRQCTAATAANQK
jgi:hypothetical protein